jgi:hypothetical protein
MMFVAAVVLLDLPVLRLGATATAMYLVDSCPSSILATMRRSVESIEA